MTRRLATHLSRKETITANPFLTIIAAVGTALQALLGLLNLVLLPADGVTSSPIALLIWTTLLLGLCGAVWRVLRRMTRPIHAAAPAATPTAAQARAPQITIRLDTTAPAPRRRRPARQQQRLSLLQRLFIRWGFVRLNLDGFNHLSRADRARYAGDKRYDPRFRSASTDADRRAFDRDRMRRVNAQLARDGWVDGAEPAAPRQRRRTLPTWMESTGATSTPPTPAAPPPSDDEASFDAMLASLTGREVPVITAAGPTSTGNADEYVRLLADDYELPPENPAYVAQFERPD